MLSRGEEKGRKVSEKAIKGLHFEIYAPLSKRNFVQDFLVKMLFDL